MKLLYPIRRARAKLLRCAFDLMPRDGTFSPIRNGGSSNKRFSPGRILDETLANLILRFCCGINTHAKIYDAILFERPFPLSIK
jgi:hypothetical protein